jgi:hypothetical protein
MNSQANVGECGHSLYVGIDNGVSGSIGVINAYGVLVAFVAMPVVEMQDYTKTKKNIHRINAPALNTFLSSLITAYGKDDVRRIRVFLERPMVNPMRFVATASALRALEATLIALENQGLAVQFVDSKQWQKVMLPQGIKGSPELKPASMEIGLRLFPCVSIEIRKQKDADSLLLAECARREKW